LVWHAYLYGRLLTVQEAALLLRCSAPTIYRRIASGELPATRLGSGPAALRISERELDTWLEDNRTTDPPRAA
jgi:excisionase family DNA binding protein